MSPIDYSRGGYGSTYGGSWSKPAPAAQTASVSRSFSQPDDDDDGGGGGGGGGSWTNYIKPAKKAAPVVNSQTVSNTPWSAIVNSSTPWNMNAGASFDPNSMGAVRQVNDNRFPTRTPQQLAYDKQEQEDNEYFGGSSFTPAWQRAQQSSLNQNSIAQTITNRPKRWDQAINPPPTRSTGMDTSNNANSTVVKQQRPATNLGAVNTMAPSAFPSSSNRSSNRNPDYPFVPSNIDYGLADSGGDLSKRGLLGRQMEMVMNGDYSDIPRYLNEGDSLMIAKDLAAKGYKVIDPITGELRLINESDIERFRTAYYMQNAPWHLNPGVQMPVAQQSSWNYYPRNWGGYGGGGGGGYSSGDSSWVDYLGNMSWKGI